MSENGAEVEEIVDEAKSTFNLKARLEGRDRRTSKVTIFTDEVTGAKHIAAEGAVNSHEAVKSALGDAWSKEQQKSLVTATKERDALETELKKSAITLHLQAVPPVIAKDGIRVARKVLKITGQASEEQNEEINTLSFLHTLSKAVTKVNDHATGEEHSSLSFENARALKDYLHPIEQAKVEVALAELQYRGVISNTVTADADF